jgi:hypothetical protein
MDTYVRVATPTGGVLDGGKPAADITAENLEPAPSKVLRVVAVTFKSVCQNFDQDTPNCYSANQMTAITVGRVAKFQSTRTRERD